MTFFFLSLSSGIYTESGSNEVREKCAKIIFDNEKIPKIKLNHEDTNVLFLLIFKLYFSQKLEC